MCRHPNSQDFGGMEISMGNDKYPEQLVFGLDIGTRSVVGMAGYKENNQFIVEAHCVREHETRAMLDGQIHDIDKVTETIREVKEALEKQLDVELNEVCIAAAGRVLKTVRVTVEYVFASETAVNEEHVNSLNLMGVEKAYNTLREELGEGRNNFYCVGYTVVNYTLNGYSMMKLNGHKASKIGTELIATFLPDEVINGLYTAVETAGLKVATLTLEPIAAINVAIPEKFRLLNIAMVDVGAGTSDICITKDGGVIAYGMIPYAGDEITEYIAQKYLVEFKVAENIKTSCLRKKKVSFKDVMGIAHHLTTQEVLQEVSEIVTKITNCIAERILELNGGKSVSAVFIVGGGGKIPGFVENIAQYLNLPKERVALRGEDVLGSVTFKQENIKKDSLLVTPIGICLNYYDQSNNFIFVNVNGEHIKIYYNKNLTISDAAIQMGYPNRKLFPQRGKSLEFTINGVPRSMKGSLGEAAHIKLNDETVGLSHNISNDDRIEIIASTVGRDAQCELRKLPEYHGSINIMVNGTKVFFPKLIKVNSHTVAGNYMIQNNDIIEISEYYTLKQALEYMDLNFNGEILVNNAPADMEQKIYENDSIQFVLNPPKKPQSVPPQPEAPVEQGSHSREQNTYSENPASASTEPASISVEQTSNSMEQAAGSTKQTSNSMKQASGFTEQTSNSIEQASASIEPAPNSAKPVPFAGQASYSAEHTSASAGNASHKELYGHAKKEERPAVKEEPKIAAQPLAAEEEKATQDIFVTVNSKAVRLMNKKNYIFVDVFDFYPFDLSTMKGTELVVMLNGERAEFTAQLKDKDKIEIFWKN